MIVKCLKCGSPEVVLEAKIDVKFQFADKGGVVLVTDVADDIYWGVEYEGVQAVCECKKCGHHFSYDEWRESLEQKEGGSKMNKVEKLLKGYENYSFQSSMYETPEFRTFCTKLKNAMKKDISENYPDLEISAWSKGHFEVSGFITRKSDGAIFYFSISDVRCWNVATSQQMYRSARHLKDYTGGIIAIS